MLTSGLLSAQLSGQTCVVAWRVELYIYIVEPITPLGVGMFLTAAHTIEMRTLAWKRAAKRRTASTMVVFSSGLAPVLCAASRTATAESWRRNTGDDDSGTADVHSSFLCA